MWWWLILLDWLKRSCSAYSCKSLLTIRHQLGNSVIRNWSELPNGSSIITASWGVIHANLPTSRKCFPHNFQRCERTMNKRVAQFVTYGLLVTRMNMAEHERFTQYKRINHHIKYFTIGMTLLRFKRCVGLINKSKRIVGDRDQRNKGLKTWNWSY